MIMIGSVKRTAAAVVASGAVALAGGASAARAGGIFVPGYGSQAQPRAGAFVAKADDPTALYHNPAGLAKQRGSRFHLGVNLLDFDQKFTRTGSYETPIEGDPESFTGDPYPTVEQQDEPALGIGTFQGIPTLAATTDLGGRSPLVLGIGIIAENGYVNRDYGAFGSGYTFEDPAAPSPPQRYDVLSTEALAAFPSLAAAYSFGALDLGARVSWGFASIKGTTNVWGLRNYEEDIHKDGEVTADVSDWFVPAVQVGLLYRPHPAIELGAQWTSQRSIHAKGTGQAPLGRALDLLDTGMPFVAPVTSAGNPDQGIPPGMPQCADGGTVTALKVCADSYLPQTATLGGRFILRDADGAERGDLEADVQWEDWSEASDDRIFFDGMDGQSLILLDETFKRHGFKDTWSFRLGGAYDVPVAGRAVTVRAGVAHDTAAAPVSWTRLDKDGMPRTTFGLGLGYTVGSVRLDVGGGYAHEPTRTVAGGCNPVGPPDDIGCGDVPGETPQDDRTAPDPVQPLLGPKNQVQSPYNDGVYQQHYVLFSLGATYSF